MNVIPRPMRPNTVDNSISLDDLQHFSIHDVLGPNVVFGITIHQLNTIRLAPVLCLVRYNTVASADRANIEETYQCNSRDNGRALPRIYAVVKPFLHVRWARFLHERVLDQSTKPSSQCSSRSYSAEVGWI